MADSDFNALTKAEAHWVALARSMDETTLRRKLRECASYPANDYMDGTTLRELAGLAIVMARRMSR